MTPSTAAAMAGATAGWRAVSQGWAPRDGGRGWKLERGWGGGMGGWGGQKPQGEGEMSGRLSRRPAAISHSEKRPLTPPRALSVSRPARGRARDMRTRV